MFTACCLEDWNVVVNLGTATLRHTLGNPDDITSLLLSEADVCVEDAEVELVDEGQLHQVALQTYFQFYVA